MVIESPNGSPTVQGICRHCGLVKTYPVWPADLDRLRTTVVDKQVARW